MAEGGVLVNRKGGGALGNRNRLRHGLTTGRLPKGSGYVARITGTLHAALEDAVLTRRNEVDLHDAAVIQTAVRWERHALLCQRWLRHADGTLTADQRLAFSREIARASAERDKCIRLLGLDRRDAATITASLYAAATATACDAGEPEATGTTAEPA